MYSKKVLEHFQNPRFAGEIKNPNAIGEEGNVKCGDIMRVYLKINGNIIKDIKFQTYGCVAAIASSNALCGLVKGKTIEEAQKLTYNEILKEVDGLPPIKMHCSILGIEALRNAILDYKKS